VKGTGNYADYQNQSKYSHSKDKNFPQSKQIEGAYATLGQSNSLDEGVGLALG